MSGTGASFQGPSGPSERDMQGPSGPSERDMQGPSGPSERDMQGPSGPSERDMQGWDVRRYAEADSTNRVMVDMAREGAPDGVVVVADHQTAGRGRLGRTWVAPPGSSLLVSVLLRGLQPDLLQLATLAAGVAAADACFEVTGFEARLKWPNDVTSDDLKLAGILTEFVPPDGVVVGLGLNANWHQPLPEGATALNHLTGADVDREALLRSFLPRLRAGVWALEHTRLRQELLDRYRRLSSTVGRTVSVRLEGRQVAARAVGIDPRGHLVVEREGQTHSVSAEGISHLEDK